jgi:hypothetical protein
MRLSSASWFALFGCVALATTVALATPPWQFFNIKRVEADPAKPYALAESNGPWMIMCTTFHGEDAEQKAHKLVLELRSQYKLSAFMHKQSYDYKQRGLQGIGLNPDGTPKSMTYARQEKFDEIAVLVGDFRSVDDPEGRKTLKMLKSAEPECMKVAKKSEAAGNSFDDLRHKAEQVMGGGLAKGPGPLGMSFLTTNPLLPKDYYAPQGIDKFVVDLNKGVEHDLLSCKGRYSVKIATYTGKVTIDQLKIHDIERGGHDWFHSDANKEDPLHVAGQKAHALAEELRKQGVEAYEFHDRYSSIVTVGSYDSVGTPQSDGKIEINPAMYEIMKTYGPDQSAVMSGQAGMTGRAVKITLEGKKNVPVLLDLQPTPVEVPRRSIGADYQTSLLR